MHPCYSVLFYSTDCLSRQRRRDGKYICPVISRPLPASSPPPPPISLIYCCAPPPPSLPPARGSPSLVPPAVVSLPFAQTYRSLSHPPTPPPPCHLFCPELKIHFHNPSPPPPAAASPGPSPLRFNPPPVFSRRGFMARPEVEETCSSQKSDSSR